MDLPELRETLSREQDHTELQPLADDFYKQVGEYIGSLRHTRHNQAADTDTPFDDPDIQQLSDELSTAETLAITLYNRRITKVLNKAVLAAFGYETDLEAMTPAEQALFEETVSQINTISQELLPNNR